MEDSENFKSVRGGCSNDIKKFAALLDVLVVNLLEAGLHEELENESLSIKLLKKLLETLLTQYNRWIFENQTRECPDTQKKWIIQESEFCTVAREGERERERERECMVYQGEEQTVVQKSLAELRKLHSLVLLTADNKAVDLR